MKWTRIALVGSLNLFASACGSGPPAATSPSAQASPLSTFCTSDPATITLQIQG